MLIFFVSTRPNLHPPGPDFIAKDKVAHFGEYFILGVLLFGGIGWTVSRSRYATFMFLFAVGVSIAAFDELVQSYIPGRRMDLTDWLADGAGVVMGIGLGMVMAGMARKRNRPADPTDTLADPTDTLADTSAVAPAIEEEAP